MSCADYARMYVHARVYVYLYLYVFVCVRVCMYMCMCMYMYLSLKQLREAKKNETIVEGHQHVYFPQRRTAQL